MQTIRTFLAADHKRCDELFAAAEDGAADKNWDKVVERFAAFHEAMERHFTMEEEVLFAEYEGHVGGPTGPSNVMRMEHRQMRELFQEMAQAVEGRDVESFLGLSETLLVMMQQHNMKEEQILYPMIDGAMAAERDGLLERVKSALGGVS